MPDLQGNIYEVILNGRADTWELAYTRALSIALDEFEARNGQPPTHISLPSSLRQDTLGLNGLQVRRQPIGRGSLALWALPEAA